MNRLKEIVYGDALFYHKVGMLIGSLVGLFIGLLVSERAAQYDTFVTESKDEAGD